MYPQYYKPIFESFSVYFFIPVFCFGAIEPYLKPAGNKLGCTTIRNIDCIYLINLDKRGEKLYRCLEQLLPYGIFPHRFSAIYGWDIPFSALEEIGVKFMPGMNPGLESVRHFCEDHNTLWLDLNSTSYGETVFSCWTTLGAVGCTLSHLSVLKDAEASGYETIWIMEDDIAVNQDPRQLSELIDKLDAVIGKGGWDVLYTDYNYLWGVDTSQNLQTGLPMKWRPDMPGFELEPLFENIRISEDFSKIGSRIRTHSMIFRRSGIEKVRKFYQEHEIFIPYDHEIAFVPDLRFYCLNFDLIGCSVDISDTYHKKL